MSVECLRNCPLINNDLQILHNTAYYYGVGTAEDADQLLADCKASYGCSGPQPTEVVEVIKGFFKKRTETEQVYVCQHPDQIQG